MPVLYEGLALAIVLFGHKQPLALRLRWDLASRRAIIAGKMARLDRSYVLDIRGRDAPQGYRCARFQRQMLR